MMGCLCWFSAKLSREWVEQMNFPLYRRPNRHEIQLKSKMNVEKQVFDLCPYSAKIKDSSSDY